MQYFTEYKWLYSLRAQIGLDLSTRYIHALPSNEIQLVFYFFTNQLGDSNDMRIN